MSLLVAAAASLTSCATRGLPPEHQIANFGRVDAGLYRGAQPNREGLENLAHLGIKTVVNLRRDTLPAEEATVRDLGMSYVTLPLSGIGSPSDERLHEIVAAIENSSGPVFLHCQHGCDRTGVVVAAWRIQHGWDAPAALREAQAYGISPLLTGFKARILHFKPH